MYMHRAATSLTPQSDTDSADKSGRSAANTAVAAGTGRSSRTGRDTKSYVLSLRTRFHTPVT